ncbi:hypothetical protein HC928_22260 [bacterium]|nr:hypothetical protein [bacterium]
MRQLYQSILSIERAYRKTERKFRRVRQLFPSFPDEESAIPLGMGDRLF